MQTGQNSIAPESSLPQFGHVRWGSVLMDLRDLWPQSEPKTPHASASGVQTLATRTWHTVVPFQKQLRAPLY